MVDAKADALDPPNTSAAAIIIGGDGDKLTSADDGAGKVARLNHHRMQGNG